MKSNCIEMLWIVGVPEPIMTSDMARVEEYYWNGPLEFASSNRTPQW